MKQLKFRAFQEGRGWASAVTVLGDGEVSVVWRDPMYRSEHFPLGMPVDICNAQKDGWVIEQFTSCVDCNGTEIYEGDILRLSDMSQLPASMLSEIDGRNVGYVVFDTAMFCFGIELKGKNELQARNLGMIAPLSVVVIGNIHENRDLING